MAGRHAFQRFTRISQDTGAPRLQSLVPKATPFCTIPAVGFRSFSRLPNFSILLPQCSCPSSLLVGRQAHALMILSGFSPSTFLSNSLINMYLKCSQLKNAENVFSAMHHKNVISYNSLIGGYFSSGLMKAALELFDEMKERDVVSWNTMISGFQQHGRYRESIDIFVHMVKCNFKGDGTTFAVVLKACAVMEELVVGTQVHGIAIKLGVAGDVVAGGAMVDMYAKCRRLFDSVLAFEEMSEKNSVSWGALIAGCVQNDCNIMSLVFFKRMKMADMGSSQAVLASVFRACAGVSSLTSGLQLHAEAVKTNFVHDSLTATAILDMYAKCGCLHEAQKVFDSLPSPLTASYNAILVGYGRNCQGFFAMKVFKLLLSSSSGFDEVSISATLSACASDERYMEGIQVHGFVTKTCSSYLVGVMNALTDMYGKCKDLGSAIKLFDEMEIRDSVSWNSAIAALEQNGEETEALRFFSMMVGLKIQPEEFTYGSALKACVPHRSWRTGMEIHARIIRSAMNSNLFLAGALVDMYAKCGKMKVAETIHTVSGTRSMVSWNSLISGFAMNEEPELAQAVFLQMLQAGIRPDNFTFSSILDACANLATIGLGRQVHALILKHQLQDDVYISSALLDMYCKSGNLRDSELLFSTTPAAKDVVTWNAMICGYSHHGLGEEALRAFSKMRSDNINPNHHTFLYILRACAHMGSAEQGLFFFNMMQEQYHLQPGLEHYSCVVDILGRAGRLREATELIHGMPFEADAVIWRTMLSACKLHGDVEMAETATEEILRREPSDSSACVLLMAVYGDAGQWRRVGEIRRAMKNSGMKKEPGCSWIEVRSELHMFLAGDREHPRRKDVCALLAVMLGEMNCAGVEHDFDDV